MSAPKLCPFRFSREGDDALCIQSACMAWRTNSRNAGQRIPISLDEEEEAWGTRTGTAFRFSDPRYCGLAGDPA